MGNIILIVAIVIGIVALLVAREQNRCDNCGHVNDTPTASYPICQCCSRARKP